MMTVTQSKTPEVFPQQTAPLLEIADLAVSFQAANGTRRRVVDGVSLAVHPRQMVAVVGESGCGKSVTALSILGLIPSPPGAIEGGSILFQNRDLLKLDRSDMLSIRGREIAMIFQEPMTSLNPVFTVGDQITEAILLHQDVTHKQAVQIAIEAMNDVGISNPAQRLRSYPHQFSGGMRQRVMIAMALACRPKLLLADEPTSALDVTIQAQILALLHDLQRRRELGILFITHDLGLVAQHADVVCVMYAGRVMEYATVFELFERPLHPYTRALLRCRPSLHKRRPRLETVAQIVSDPAEFKPLRDDHNRELIPWWTTDAGGCALMEVRPDHWIGCRALEAGFSTGAHRRPHLDFRRDR